MTNRNKKPEARDETDLGRREFIKTDVQDEQDLSDSPAP